MSGSTSLAQISLSDSKSLEESFLYELSVSEGMEWFKEVALVSSMQDDYTPFESSRIEITDSMMKSKYSSEQQHQDMGEDGA